MGAFPFILGLGVAGGVAYLAFRKPLVTAPSATVQPGAQPTPGAATQSAACAQLAQVAASCAALKAINCENKMACSKLDATGYCVPQPTDQLSVCQQAGGAPPGTVAPQQCGGTAGTVGSAGAANYASTGAGGTPLSPCQGFAGTFGGGPTGTTEPLPEPSVGLVDAVVGTSAGMTSQQTATVYADNAAAFGVVY